MANYVPDDGVGNEKLVIIGEAGGRNENRERKPFVGAAGYRLLDWMNPVGLRRTDAYWSNVYPYQPLANKIETVPRATLEPWIAKLHERIAALTDPIVLVPTGNTALRALTGFGYFPWESKRRGEKKHKMTVPGIMLHRGSIYEYTDLNGRKIKVIPTIHPAATFRMPSYEKRCILDWQRIAGDLQFRELKLPYREHHIPKTVDELHELKRRLLDHDKPILVIDAEWLPGGFCLCVGFSSDPDWSLTIPTTEQYWGSAVDTWEAWQVVKELCESDIEKCLQHGHSDAYVLKRVHNITIRNYRWDTLAMHHLLDPNDDHNLAYLASIYTRQPYWKDTHKDPEKVKAYASNIEALHVYNGIDCCVERELFDVLSEKLVENGLLDVA